MTATRGAELTGESVATCSYHLNTLAKYGFIESAAANNGCERPWRLISYDRSWRAGGEGLDDEGAVAAVALSDVVADEIASHLKEWFRRRSREDQEWVDAAGLSQGIAYLTTSELAEITGEFRECVNRYDDRVHDTSKRPAGARSIKRASGQRSASRAGHRRMTARYPPRRLVGCATATRVRMSGRDSSRRGHTWWSDSFPVSATRRRTSSPTVAARSRIPDARHMTFGRITVGHFLFQS